MDKNVQAFIDKKNLIEKQIAEALLDAVKKNQLDFNNLQTVSKEILLEFEPISSMEQMIPFLEKISQKWTFFSNLYTIYKNQTQTTGEQQIISKLSDYIKTQS